MLVLHNSHFDIFMQKSGSPCPLRVGYWARVLTLASHTVLATKGRVLPHTALQRIVRRGSESQQFIPFTNLKSRSPTTTIWFGALSRDEISIRLRVHL